LAYFGIIKPIFNAVGLTDSKEDREADRAIDEFRREQYLSSLPYSENKSKVTISQTKANQLAIDIYQSKGVFYDNEDTAVGSIKSASTKINVSYLAYRFYQLYQRDLQSYLESFLESDNWSDLNEALDKMKKY
jgi:superoxide dismutase